MSELTRTGLWPFPVDDPYPAYASAREAGPVLRDESLDAWLVLDHRHGRAVLADPTFSSDPGANPALFERLGGNDPGGALLSRVMFFTDPPAHDRLRRAVSRWFTPRQVGALRARIVDLVAAAWPAPGERVDVMATLARPVPLAVVAELLDVGADAATVLFEEADALTATIDPMAGPDARARATSAALAVSLALIPVVAARRSEPGRDLVTALLEELDTDEVTVMALTLLAAGHVTTANLIATMWRTLDGDQLGRLRSQPELVPAAVEELLRWESPAQLVGRVASGPVSLGGCPIGAGDLVLVVVGAANRDPLAYDDPDVFDIERFSSVRRPPPSLAFGHGAHACVGAALARLEATQVLHRLAAGGPWTIDRCESSPSASFRRVDSLMATAPGAG